MADVSARTPIFSRGSTVLDYWLAHAEGLTIQPSGARVEEVVVVAPVGRAQSLIVRSRMMRRRKEIPAGSIAAVEPASGHLLLDAAEPGAGLRLPRPSQERIAAARAHAAGAARSTHAGTSSAVTWLQPRAIQATTTIVRHGRVAAARTAAGAAWLTPRVATTTRRATAAGARWTLAIGVILARGAVRAARGLERTTAAVADRVRMAVEARRAPQRRAPDE
jgi:hypothetical protein